MPLEVSSVPSDVAVPALEISYRVEPEIKNALSSDVCNPPRIAPIPAVANSSNPGVPNREAWSAPL